MLQNHESGAPVGETTDPYEEITDPTLRRALASFVHVRRYKKFYGVGVIWALAMLLLPVADPFTGELGADSGGWDSGAMAPADDDAAGTTLDGAGDPGAGGGSAGDFDGPLDTATAGAPSTGAPVAGGSDFPADLAGDAIGDDVDVAAPPDLGAPPPGGGTAPGSGSYECELDEQLPAPVASQVLSGLAAAQEAIGQALPVDPVNEAASAAGCRYAPSSGGGDADPVAEVVGLLDGLALPVSRAGTSMATVAAGGGSPTDVLASLAGDAAEVDGLLSGLATAAATVQELVEAGELDAAEVAERLAPAHGRLAQAVTEGDGDALAAAGSLLAQGLPADGLARQNAFLPSVPVPELPEELQPALELFGPLLAEACGNIGFASVAVVLVGGTTDEVPMDLIFPVLETLILVCAQVPFPDTVTVCGLDESSPADDVLRDVGGDLPVETPNAVGTIVGQLLAVERVLAEQSGQELPASIADAVSDQLDCTTTSLGSTGGTSFDDDGGFALEDGAAFDDPDGSSGSGGSFDEGGSFDSGDSFGADGGSGSDMSLSVSDTAEGSSGRLPMTGGTIALAVLAGLLAVTVGGAALAGRRRLL